MNLEAIEKTALCYFSRGDECYVVQSPLFYRAIGTGDTRQEAWSDFSRSLKEYHAYYTQGRLDGYGQPGLPRKETFDTPLEVSPATKERIHELTQHYGATPGEVIDFLVGFVAVGIMPSREAQADTLTLSESSDLPE